MTSFSFFKKLKIFSSQELIGVLVGIFCLLPRWDGGFFSGKYLWAEDGSIFINQLFDLGLDSLLNPYMGYIHLYPRLVMLFASNFSFIDWPLVMLGGWFLSYLILLFIINNVARSFGFTSSAVIMLTAMISLQPNNAEVFFNLTNSQWMLAVSYSLLLVKYLTQSKSYQYSKSTIFLLLLGLTGPFSIVLLATAGIYSLIFKEFKKNYKLILVILVPTFIQMFFLWESSRVTHGQLDLQIFHWVLAFFRVCIFGGEYLITNLLAFIFWGG